MLAEFIIPGRYYFIWKDLYGTATLYCPYHDPGEEEWYGVVCDSCNGLDVLPFPFQCLFKEEDL